MKPTSHEQDKQHAFDSFCKKVLKHEAHDFQDEIKRQREREVTLSELSEREAAQLSTTDEYFAGEHIFSVLGRDVVVKGDFLAEALESLPEQRRDIILLKYFLGLSDGAIGDKLNLIRATVQFQRTSSLKQLKKIMEGGNADERHRRKK